MDVIELAEDLKHCILNDGKASAWSNVLTAWRLAVVESKGEGGEKTGRKPWHPMLAELKNLTVGEKVLVRFASQEERKKFGRSATRAARERGHKLELLYDWKPGGIALYVTRVS